MAILAAAAEVGWKTHLTDRPYLCGFPCVVLVRGHRLILAHIVEDGETRVPSQEEWGDALDIGPAEYYVFRPSDFPAILSTLGACIDTAPYSARQ